MPTPYHRPSHLIDLRSDTVTRPTKAMRRAMASAEVGDDVLGDDPTVHLLQHRVAELMGTQAALFVPSGSMANQLAIRSLCQSGDEIICHKDNHIIHYETGAPASLSGVMIQPVDGPRGQWTADQLPELIRADNAHHPRSRLVVLENTHNRGGGSVWDIDKVAAIAKAARGANLHMHLDGARLWNACIASGRKPSEYAKHFDTISCCFSKGLGAPVGSALCGSHQVITLAHRFRKMFGGAMRQSGVLAAAALHALDHHYDRLETDHAHAKVLCTGLSELTGITLALPVATNMVFVDVSPALGTASDFAARLKALGVLTLPSGPQRLRLVTHLDVTRDDIDSTISAFGRITARHQPGIRRAAEPKAASRRTAAQRSR